MTLAFKFKFEYSKTGFAFKVGSLWYGFGFKGAEATPDQSKKLETKLHHNDKDMANYDKFYIVDDLNTLYFGFGRISWRRRKRMTLDELSDLNRNEHLNQKANHYDHYKNRKNEWSDEK